MDAAQIRTMVAIHEAGHAVSAYFLQLPFKKIELHPLEGPGNFGKLIMDEGPDIAIDDGDPKERERVEKKIICMLSGPAAECRYTGGSPWAGGGSDLPYAIQYACRRFAYGTEAELKEEMLRLWLRARQLIGSPEGWNCVRRVAAGLDAFGSLDQNLCGKLIREQQKRIRDKNPHTEVTVIMDKEDYGRIENDLGVLLVWQ